MIKTINYNLRKPEMNDTVNINDFNDNFDILDTKLKEIETNVSNISSYSAVDSKVSAIKEDISTIETDVSTNTNNIQKLSDEIDIINKSLTEVKNNTTKNTNDNQKLSDEIDIINKSLTEVKNNTTTNTNDNQSSAINYGIINNNLLTKFYEKIKNKEKITICARGENTVYGQAGCFFNTNDNREPLGDNGELRAAITWTESLDNVLKSIYGEEKVEVINRGHVNDTTKESYERWTESCGSDITIVCLGRVDYNDSVNLFMKNYRLLIEQELSWNSGVIVMLPLKMVSGNDPDLNEYRKGLIVVAKEYNCPVIDGLEMIKNYSSLDIMNNHKYLNKVGYDMVGKRIASYFIGKGILYPKEVYANDTLLTRVNIDSFLMYGKKRGLLETNGSGNIFVSPEANYSYVIRVSNISSVTYSFKTMQDNLVFIPIYYADNIPSTMTLGTIELDFDALPQYNSYTNVYERFPSKITLPKGGSYCEQKNAHDYVNAFNFTEKSIVITCKGWHTITIKSEINMDEYKFYFQGFKVVSLEDIRSRTLIEGMLTDFPITEGTFKAGERYLFTNPTTHIGCIVTENGSFGNIDTGVKGTIYKTGINIIKIDSDGSLTIGDRVIIEGDTSNTIYKITDKKYNFKLDSITLEFDKTLGTTELLSNARLIYAEPVIKRYGAIEE